MRVPYRKALTRSEIIFHCMEDEQIDFSGWDRADVVHAAHVLRDMVLALLREQESQTHPCQSGPSARRKEAKDGQAAPE
jgi:hypothetical protein